MASYFIYWLFWWQKGKRTTGHTSLEPGVAPFSSFLLVGLRLHVPQRVVRRDKTKVVRHRRCTVEVIHIACKHPVVDQCRLPCLLIHIYILKKCCKIMNTIIAAFVLVEPKLQVSKTSVLPRHQSSPVWSSSLLRPGAPCWVH
jgi:hypothetical protein